MTKIISACALLAILAVSPTVHADRGAKYASSLAGRTFEVSYKPSPTRRLQKSIMTIDQVGNLSVTLSDFGVCTGTLHVMVDSSEASVTSLNGLACTNLAQRRGPKYILFHLSVPPNGLGSLAQGALYVVYDGKRIINMRPAEIREIMEMNSRITR